MALFFNEALMKTTLSKEKSVSEPFAFEGLINIMITGGFGSVTLERKLEDSPFYPYSTDTRGGVACFNVEGGCAYNGSLTEEGASAEYRFTADVVSGEIEIIITRVR